MLGKVASSGAVAIAVGLIVGLSLLAVDPAAAEETLKIVEHGGRITVAAAERPLLEYQFTPQPMKPYVGRLFTPAGVQVLRDAPHDHLHHHSLMFAVAVDGVDFWSEHESCGSQQHRSLGDTATYRSHGVDWATLGQRIDWTAPGSEKPLLGESRRIDACRLPDSGPTLLVWRSQLRVPAEKQAVTLTGSTYFGLGARFVESMDTAGHFQNAERNRGVDGTNDVRSRWCAYSSAANGKPVTVAIFDYPANRRHPATWFTMDTPFAYLAATLNLSRQPLLIESDQPLQLRYAVALWDGKVSGGTIESLYQRLLHWAAEEELP